MLVLIRMKGGALYKGIKCGNDGGFVFLVNPWELTEDDRGELMPGQYMEGPVGEEVFCMASERVRILLLPIADVETIESAR